MNMIWLRTETRTALPLALAEIERARAGVNDPAVAGLLERAEADIVAGWHETACDALGRARALLAVRFSTHYKTGRPDA